MVCKSALIRNLELNCQNSSSYSCSEIGLSKHLPVFLLGTENVMGWWMTKSQKVKKVKIVKKKNKKKIKQSKKGKKRSKISKIRKVKK